MILSEQKLRKIIRQIVLENAGSPGNASSTGSNSFENGISLSEYLMKMFNTLREICEENNANPESFNSKALYYGAFEKLTGYDASQGAKLNKLTEQSYEKGIFLMAIEKMLQLFITEAEKHIKDDDRYLDEKYCEALNIVEKNISGNEKLPTIFVTKFYMNLYNDYRKSFGKKQSFRKEISQAEAQKIVDAYVNEFDKKIANSF